jgi:hypothetical protein
MPCTSGALAHDGAGVRPDEYANAAVLELAKSEIAAGVLRVHGDGTVWRLIVRHRGGGLRAIEPRTVERRNPNGSTSVVLYARDSGRTVSVSTARLVYETLHGEVPVGARVIHVNGDTGDNTPNNLALSGNTFSRLVMTPKRRFMSQIREAAPPREGLTGNCWIWTAGKLGRYGRMSFSGRPESTHRVAWMIFRGPIPRGLFVCHHCDTPACVNPGHLFLGTPKENAADYSAKGYERTRRYRSGQTALSPDAVVAIKLWLTSGVSRQRLAEAFGVSVGAIRAIVENRSWRHVFGGTASAYAWEPLPEASRRAATAPMRRHVFCRDKGVCQICFQPVGHEPWHADHVTPWSLGGPTEVSNLRLTHARCNPVLSSKKYKECAT